MYVIEKRTPTLSWRKNMPMGTPSFDTLKDARRYLTEIGATRRVSKDEIEVGEDGYRVTYPANVKELKKVAKLLKQARDMVDDPKLVNMIMDAIDHIEGE